MSQEIKNFIDTAREKGLSDDDIKNKLLLAGWEASLIDSAISGLVVPMPPSSNNLEAPKPDQLSGSQPITVVNNQSTRGLEYNIMFLSLVVAAFGFAGLLHDLVDQITNTEVYFHIGGVFAITALIVLGPIFTWLFFRLKKAEDEKPELRKDPFRKKWIQSTLLITFLIGIFHIIYFVYDILAPDSNGLYDYYTESTGNKTLGLAMHVLVTLLVAGGIFVYYWIDEHKNES